MPKLHQISSKESAYDPAAAFYTVILSAGSVVDTSRFGYSGAPLPPSQKSGKPMTPERLLCHCRDAFSLTAKNCTTANCFHPSERRRKKSHPDHKIDGNCFSRIYNGFALRDFRDQRAKAFSSLLGTGLFRERRRKAWQLLIFLCSQNSLFERTSWLRGNTCFTSSATTPQV